MSDWHKKEITKGVLGDLSKIREELEEAEDSLEQDQLMMLLFELSDICGAAGLVAQKITNGSFGLDELVKFSKLRSKVAIKTNV
jgi:hypothetical protein